MKIEKTKAIVLRQIKYGESSLIVDMLTPNMGLQSFIVSGVRKKKPQFHPYYFQALNTLEVIYYESNKSELLRVKELNSPLALQNIEFNVNKNSIRLFLAEMIRLTSKKSEPDERLFLFLEQLIEYIDCAEDEEIKNIHLWTLVKLMSFSGILPDNNYNSSLTYFNPVEARFEPFNSHHVYIYSERLSFLLFQLLNSNINNNHDIIFTQQERRDLLQKMVDYFQLHIPNFSTNKSLDILFSIFE